MNEIRRMPKPEFERPKRRVSYPVYFACVMAVGLLWLLLEDGRNIHWSTSMITVFGLMHIGKGMARFIANEIAITGELKVLKETK